MFQYIEFDLADEEYLLRSRREIRFPLDPKLELPMIFGFVASKSLAMFSNVSFNVYSFNLISKAGAFAFKYRMAKFV